MSRVIHKYAMYINIVTVFLLVAATARHVPENDGPRLISAPMDFPRQPPLHRMPESLGTGVIGDRGNGAIIPQENPRHFNKFSNVNNDRNKDESPRHFDEFSNANNNRNHNENPSHFNEFPNINNKRNHDGRRANYQPKYNEFELKKENDRIEPQENSKPIDGIGFENNRNLHRSQSNTAQYDTDNMSPKENSKNNYKFGPASDRNLDKSKENRKTIQENPPPDENGTINGYDHKAQNNIQNKIKTVKNMTLEETNIRQNPLSDQVKSELPKVTVPNNFKNNTINKTSSKTIPNSTKPNKTPKTNEVTDEPEEKTTESDVKDVIDDKWIWSTTTTTTTTVVVDVGDRAAFDGDCPTGQVRVQGSTKCVDKDED